MPLQDTPDYQTLIDTETWDFIKRTESWYPPDTIDYSIERQREIYDAMCQAFNKDYPADMRVADSIVEHERLSVPVRRYTSPSTSNRAHIVYFHGGGFIVGGLDSHDDVCAELCDRTRLGVTSVDYRLAPEYPHPAAFQDSLAAVRFEAHRLQIPLLLCGDSAGGNLASAVSHKLRNGNQTSHSPDIIGQVLIYPGLGGDTTAGSYMFHAQAPMLTTRDVHYYMQIRAPDNCSDSAMTGISKATHSPLQDSDFSGLPPTVIVSAECDPLSDDGLHYSDAINRAGGTATWFNERGLVHGYLRARTSVARAERSFTRIVNAMHMLANSDWYD